MRAFKQIIIWSMVMSAGWAQTPGTEGKKTVAILDFEGRGISQMEAATLTDRLMSEMVATNAVILVERNQMNEIMEEQGLQQNVPPKWALCLESKIWFQDHSVN